MSKNIQILIVILLSFISFQYSYSAYNSSIDSLDMEVPVSYSGFNYSNDTPISIYIGIYTPFGVPETFGARPVIGASAGMVHKKFTLDICGKIRININDKAFKYTAMDSTYLVDSKASIYVGGIAGYKIIDKNDICVIPNIAFGFESTFTGLAETNDDDEIVRYNNLNNISLTAGVSVLRTVLYNKKVGVNFSYNYTPHLSRTYLLSPMKTQFLAIEAVFQF